MDAPAAGRQEYPALGHSPAKKRRPSASQPAKGKNDSSGIRLLDGLASPMVSCEIHTWKTFGPKKNEVMAVLTMSLADLEIALELSMNVFVGWKNIGSEI